MISFTLNLEAPGRPGTDLVALLAPIVGDLGSIKLRRFTATYDGPDGRVETPAWVAKLATHRPWADVSPQLVELSSLLLQDCLGVRRPDGVVDLIGPAADRWLPARPELFTDY